MRALAFSFSMLKRDWRSGEIRLIAIALIIAVGAVTAISFFTDRVRQAMEMQASVLLAADLAVDSLAPLPETLTEKAHALNLKTARTLVFRSMVSVHDKLQLAEVKAVDEHYPLRGRLLVAEHPFDRPAVTDQIPAPGTVWLNAQLIQALHLAVGQEIELGTARFVVNKVLLFEPDRGIEVFHIAPRLLMNIDDVPATGLLSWGNWAHHRLLLSGARKDIETYRLWARDVLDKKQRLIRVRDAQPQLKAILERADQFLGLVALISVCLAGIAIATAARRFAARHLDSCAVMRCLGAAQGFILRVYALTMLWLGLATSVIGCVVGFLAQFGLASLSTDLTAGKLPSPSLLPVLTGTLTGLIALLGFAMPPLMRLKDVPPARVLRRDLLPHRRPAYTVYLSAILAIAVLITWHAGELRLALYVLGGSFATVSVLAIASWILVNGLKLLRSQVGVAWRYGFTNVARRSGSSVVQIVALGLGIMVLLLLTLVRSDLLADWQARVPPEAPTHFVINIQPDEVAAVRDFFVNKGLPAPTLYPILHGRLLAINGAPAVPESYAERRARQMAKREFHLTWLVELPAGNRIVAGRWWSPDDIEAHQFSIESGLAETLGIALGDTLTYQVADQQITATVTSLRSVEWESFNPNFFVIVPPRLLDSYPATYITSFYLPQHKKPLLSELVKTFPSVTLLEVAALIRRIRSIIDQVTMAVEFIFTFTLVAGLLVLFAAIQSTRDERLHETAVLRTLGASRQTIVHGLVTEFLSLGMVAGLVAALGATAIGYVLANNVFESGYYFNSWLLVLGLLVGGLGVGIAGFIGTRSVLRIPPLETLRRR
jgi:Predicted ABC-type transport system involved in lysophospholipase L1 biosynthesis, permease component